MSEEEPEERETGPWHPVKMVPNYLGEKKTWQCSDLIQSWAVCPTQHRSNFCRTYHRTEEAAVKHCAALNRAKEKESR